MTMSSPILAILWETWRVTRVEAAWKLAIGIVGGLPYWPCTLPLRLPTMRRV